VARLADMAKTAIYPEGGAPPIAPYTPGILSDGILYVSGVIAMNEKGDIVHPGDAGQQMRQVIESIKSVVEVAGGTLADVVYDTIFIRDWSDYGALNTIYAEYFGNPAPARYCVQCSLVKPDALVEISSIAHIGRH
jgi:aminoacrylate peracid reductase